MYVYFVHKHLYINVKIVNKNEIYLEVMSNFLHLAHEGDLTEPRTLQHASAREFSVKAPTTSAGHLRSGSAREKTLSASALFHRIRLLEPRGNEYSYY